MSVNRNDRAADAGDRTEFDHLSTLPPASDAARPDAGGIAGAPQVASGACPAQFSATRSEASMSTPATRNLAQRVEEASLNAWPALQQMLHGGWLLRFAGGFTKRANSVTVLYDSDVEGPDLGARIEFCEGIYRKQGLAPIFRLTGLADHGVLDGTLAARGYEQHELTRVMVADLAGIDAATLAAWCHSDVSRVARETWLAGYGDLAGVPESAQQLHDLLLRGIRLECVFAAVSDLGACVLSCGLGVLERDLIGLFDVVTGAASRRRGYGKRLVQWLMQHGAAQGARYCYLQVLKTNSPAIALYGQLGFTPLYDYWYRIGQREHV